MAAPPDFAVPTREVMWALANPLRFRILELLREGPSTASRLGRRLGESRGSMSYHLRYLARAGAIEELEGEGTARERWWRRPDRPLLLPTREDPEAMAIGERYLAVFFGRDDEARRRFVSEPVGAEWQRSAFVGSWFVRLTPEEANELGLRLAGLVDEYRGRGDPPPEADQALVSVSVLPFLD